VAAITLVVLRTADLARTRAFYEALELVFTEERHGAGPVHLATVLDGDVVLELYPRRSDVEVDVARLGLRVASVAEAIRRVSALGAAVKHDGVTTIVVDPDGRKVELTS
jgi:lactoylglutathione lyase